MTLNANNWLLRHRAITAIGSVLLLATLTGIASGGDRSITTAPVADSMATYAPDQASADKAAADQAAADKAAADKAVEEETYQAALEKKAAGEAAADRTVADKAAAAKATAARAASAMPPAAGTALAAVARLTVKGRAPKTGYSRVRFGQAWADVDRNGCDTRTICSDQVEQVAAWGA